MPIDYPDQTYYPSWKVRLTIRLEEFGGGVLKRSLPKKPSIKINGIKDNPPLVAAPDPDVPGRFILKPKTGGAGNPQGQQAKPFGDTSADNLTQVVPAIIPKRFDWKQNGFRTADELKLTLRWADFPIDPRVVRAVAVEFYLGTLTATEFAQGIRGLTRGDVFGPGVPNSSEPLNVIADSYAAPGNGKQRSNLRFTGWVTKFKMAWGEDEPTVELECQDNTMLLLNQVASPRHTIGKKDPIDRAVAVYLANFPQYAGLTVEYRGEPGAQPPKLEGILAGVAFRPQLGPQPGQGAGDDLVVWDYLTDVIGSIGHIIRIEGNAIIIQRPSTVLNGVSSPRQDDPYKTRNLPAGAFPDRAFIYGRNLLGFEVTRDLANLETKNVEVRCASPRRKKLLVARFPTKEFRAPSSTPGDARADSKWTIVNITGVEDQRILQQIAEDVYHGRNRNELEVVMKTKNLASFGGGNEDPDLLDLKPGDSVEVLVDRANPSTVAGQEGMLTAKSANEQMLKNLGYPTAFAAAYASAYANAGFQRLYRVRECSVSGDTEGGVSIEVRGANFIQARADLPPAAAPSAPTSSTLATQGGGKSAPTVSGQNPSSVSKVDPLAGARAITTPAKK